MEIVIYEIAQEVLLGSTRVIVDYTMDKGGRFEYRDALHFSIEDWANQTPATIEDEQRRRHDNWIAVITAPRPEPVPPTPEEIQAQIDALTQQQRDTQAQLLALAPDDVMLSILQQQAQIIADQIAALTQQG